MENQQYKNIINWYPGHMAKAMREMQEKVKTVDCMIYVIDSRAVLSCMNPKFDELIKDKPILYILNKIDLVEKDELRKWFDWFERRKMKYLAVNSTTNRDKKQVIEMVRELNKEKIQRYLAKGAIKSVRAMVVGVPNTGKSTLINSLCGEKKAITGNRPGVTRGTQWVKLAEGVELMDTPGSLPPNFENQEHAKHLAFIGSIKEEILHLDDLAIEIINFFRTRYTELFKQRYKLDGLSEDAVQVLDAIAKNRGFLLGAGNLDYERTFRAIVDDVKKGRIGKIMFDFPN